MTIFTSKFFYIAMHAQYWVIMLAFVVNSARATCHKNHHKHLMNYHSRMDAAMASGNIDEYEVAYRSFRHYASQFKYF